MEASPMLIFVFILNKDQVKIRGNQLKPATLTQFVINYMIYCSKSPLAFDSNLEGQALNFEFKSPFLGAIHNSRLDPELCASLKSSD